MQTVIEAMQQDPDYAWCWHCNIAMAFVDAGGDHYIGNQGAARFMRMLANVEPAHELPSPQPEQEPEQEPLIATPQTAQRSSDAELMAFYGVSDLYGLIDAQEQHIHRLQTKPPPRIDEQPNKARFA